MKYQYTSYHWRQLCDRLAFIIVLEVSVTPSEIPASLGVWDLGLKASPHCRRKVRLSPNSATVAVVSPFSATVALFCDSVDRTFDWPWTISNSTVLGSDQWSGSDRRSEPNPNPIPNPNPNPSWSEPISFSFNSLLSFRSPIWTYNYPFQYRWSIGTDTLSPKDFEILRLKCIWITVLTTFLGHVTSTITWSFFPRCHGVWFPMGVHLTPNRYLELLARN